jgi:endo-1,4-beta-D-glucanase Y
LKEGAGENFFQKVFSRIQKNKKNKKKQISENKKKQISENKKIKINKRAQAKFTEDFSYAGQEHGQRKGEQGFIQIGDAEF